MPSSVQTARSQGEAQHGPQHIGVARFAPHDAADLGIDIGRHERGDGRVMTRQAKREIVLQLLLGRKAGTQDVPPTGENAQEAIGRAAQFDQAAGLGLGQLRFEKWGGAPDLGDQRLGRDPLGPCVAVGVDLFFGQAFSMTRLMPGQSAVLAYSCSTVRNPSSTARCRRDGSVPACSVRNPRSRVKSCETFTTESRLRPAERAGKRTFPGARASSRFVLIAATIAV